MVCSAGRLASIEMPAVEAQLASNAGSPSGIDASAVRPSRHDSACPAIKNSRKATDNYDEMQVHQRAEDLQNPGRRQPAT
jgi:hypothetical protein